MTDVDVEALQRLIRNLKDERDELRAAVARAEVLADWHDTVAWLNGINSMDPSRTHRDAAARLRKALAGDQS